MRPTARARIDDSPWHEMPAYPAVNAPQALAMPHHFRFAADLSGLRVGQHTVEAEVTWPDGQAVRHRAHFTLAGS